MGVVTVDGLTNDTEYTVAIRALNSEGEGASSDGVVVTPRESVTITGLTNGTVYTVKLRAVNDAGDGDASVGVTVLPPGAGGTITRTATFTLDDVEMSATPRLAGTFHVASVAFTFDDVELAASGTVVELEHPTATFLLDDIELDALATIVDLVHTTVDFTLDDIELGVDADSNAGIAIAATDTWQVDVVCRVIPHVYAPHAGPPGGLYTFDGVELLAPLTSWTPTV